MSGEGHIANIPTAFELRQRLERRIAERTAPAWDKRPGDLEATKGLEVVGVVGTHLPMGWQIGLVVTGQAEIGALTIADARKLAAEIVQLCDTLEHGVSDR